MSPANMKEPRPVAAGAALVNPLRASHRTAAVSDLQERTALIGSGTDGSREEKCMSLPVQQAPGKPRLPSRSPPPLLPVDAGPMARALESATS